MDISGFWYDDFCSNEYVFICKYYGKDILLMSVIFIKFL